MLAPRKNQGGNSCGRDDSFPVQRLQENLRRWDKNGARKGPLAIFAEKLVQNISSLCSCLTRFNGTVLVDGRANLHHLMGTETGMKWVSIKFLYVYASIFAAFPLYLIVIPPYDFNICSQLWLLGSYLLVPSSTIRNKRKSNTGKTVRALQEIEDVICLRVGRINLLLPDPSSLRSEHGVEEQIFLFATCKEM